MIRVCFVCLGNICRSPTAEAAMRHLIREAALEGRIEVDSAGTAGYHVGEAPDPRARAAGLRRGIEVSGRARKFKATDFESFDYVLAMDRSNLDDLAKLASSETRHKLALLRQFDSGAGADAAVPDPYYGGDAGFDEVIQMCLRACSGLLDHIRQEHGL